MSVNHRHSGIEVDEDASLTSLRRAAENRLSSNRRLKTLNDNNAANENYPMKVEPPNENSPMNVGQPNENYPMKVGQPNENYPMTVEPPAIVKQEKTIGKATPVKSKTPISVKKTPSNQLAAGTDQIPPYINKYYPGAEAEKSLVPCYEQPFDNIHNLEIEPKTFAKFKEEYFNSIASDQHLRPLLKFKPRPYDFMLDDYEHVKHYLKTNTRTDNIEISCPPFQTLFDHVIAILWLFYSDVNNWSRFTVAQLEWTSKFLQGLVSNRRDIFQDVEQMRKHLESLIYLIYADVDGSLLDIPKLPDKNDDKPKDIELHLPVSLASLFGRAPNFVNCLALHPSNCCDEATGNSQPDQTEMLKKLKEQLNTLDEYEKKYLHSLKHDVELLEIIQSIKNHGDELVNMQLQVEKK